jgi:hypothetical protein
MTIYTHEMEISLQSKFISLLQTSKKRILIQISFGGHGFPGAECFLMNETVVFPANLGF